MNWTNFKEYIQTWITTSSRRSLLDIEGVVMSNPCAGALTLAVDLVLIADGAPDDSSECDSRLKPLIKILVKYTASAECTSVLDTVAFGARWLPKSIEALVRSHKAHWPASALIRAFSYPRHSYSLLRLMLVELGGRGLPERLSVSLGAQERYNAVLLYCESIRRNPDVSPPDPSLLDALLRRGVAPCANLAIDILEGVRVYTLKQQHDRDAMIAALRAPPRAS